MIVIKGGSQVLLSTLIDGLGLTREDGTAFTVDEVASVSFETEGLFDVREALNGETVMPEDILIETEHDFVITSLRPFDETRMLLTLKDGTVITVKVTDMQDTNGGNVHTTVVNFYDYNPSFDGDQFNAANGDPIVPDPVLDGYYYVLATQMGNTNYLEGGTKQTLAYYAITPIDLRSVSDTSKSVSYNEFKALSVSEDGGNISTQNYGGTYYLKDQYDQINTRLFRSDVPLDVSELQVTVGKDSGNYICGLTTSKSGATVTDAPETGYKFGEGNYQGATDNIYMYRDTDNFKYKVRLRFNPGSEAVITPEDKGNTHDSKHYYVLVKVDHQKTGTGYAYTCIDNLDPKTLQPDEDGYLYIDIPFDSKWKNYTGGDRTDVFTGHEKDVEVRLVRNFKTEDEFKPTELLNEGGWTLKSSGVGQVYNDSEDFVSGYKIHYDTRDSRGYDDSIYYQERNDDTIWCIDRIDLTSTNASSDYDYTSILGPNLIYGIVAEHLYQPNHLQTNFAVNHFSGHGHDVRPDLSGDSAGNIVIGEFNVSDGSKRNSVGEVAYDTVWGRLKVGKPLAGPLFVYVDDDSGYMEGDNLANVYDNDTQTIVVPSNGESLSQTIVEPGINYMKRISAELLSKPNTVSPQISGNTATVDATPFDDYDTIYIDGDMLVEAGVLDNTGGLTIKKKPNQTIVFNFNDRSTSRDIAIKKFKVIQDDFPGYPKDGVSTDSPEATGTDQNDYMDDIARHVVWNLAACTRKVKIDTAGGIFLQPNDDSEIEIAGTTAGWIVSDGYVYNGTAEWHNVFEEMPESVSVQLYAQKRLDGKSPTGNQKFQFKLEKLVYTQELSTGMAQHPTWEEIDSKTNSLSRVAFKTLQQSSEHLHEGWNIFRITETGPTVDTTDSYITDTRKHYAAVYLAKDVIADKNADKITYRVSPPLYYNYFDEYAFQPFKPNSQDVNELLTGVGEGHGEILPMFQNETVKTGLTLMKRVDGTDATNKKFTFEIRLWNEEGGTRSNLTTISELISGTRKFSLTSGNWEEGGGTYSRAEVELRNGQKITFENVPAGAHYEFREIKVGGKDISVNKDSEGYVDGYRSAMFEDDGSGNITYTLSGVADDPATVKAETFVNEYKSKGEIPLHVTKAMKNGKTLLDDMFTFTVTCGDKVYTGLSKANGTVVFADLPEGKLTFTQDDMIGAKKNELGYLVKEIAFTIHEGAGELDPDVVNAAWGVNNFSYDNVVYEEDKTVTLTLIDKGEGAIEVLTKDRQTEATVGFENDYKEKAKANFTGTKIMERRPMDKGEFTFNAVLNTIDDEAVPTQKAISDATTDAERAAAIEAYNELLKKVSPVDVIGVNRAVATPASGTTSYSAAIDFPEISYAEAGTYVYTITEDTSTMPADAEAVTPLPSYTATVVVAPDATGVLKASVTYSDSVQFTNRPKTIGFDVTKDWQGVAGAGSKYVTISMKYDGITPVKFENRDGAIRQIDGNGVVTKTGVGEGTVTVDGNDIRLTSDASGNWPIAHFEGMRADRYVVKEIAHTDVGGDVVTTYALTVREPNAENAEQLDVVRTQIGNIVRNDNDLLTITNKASKQKKGEIVIHKVWKAGDTEFVPDDGEATFKLYYHKQWEEEEGAGGTSIPFKWEESTYIWDSATGTGGLVTFADINTEGYIGPDLVVTFNVRLENGKDTFLSRMNQHSPKVEVSYGTETTNFSGSKDVFGLDSDRRVTIYGELEKAPTEEDPTAVVTFTFPTSGKVGDYTIDTSKLKGIRVEGKQNMADGNDGSWSCAGASIKTTKTTKTEPGVILVDGEETFKITKNDVVNGQPWTKKISGLMMSDTSNNATWQYYVVETSNSTNGKFTVDYPGGISGHSSMATDKGTIEVTNTTDTVNKKVVKAWQPSIPAGKTVTLGLYQGKTEAEAGASTKPFRTIELDGTVDTASDTYESAVWTASFNNLPKYDMQGNTLYYVVKEITGPNGYTPKYGESATATWVLASDTDAATPATITNVPEPTEIFVRKTWANNLPAADEVEFWVFTKNDQNQLVEVTTKINGTTFTDDERHIKLNAANRWTNSLADLPKYDQEGNLIQYYVRENGVRFNTPSNYKWEVGNYFTVEPADAAYNQAGIQVPYNNSATHPLTIDNTPLTTQISVSKAWEDDGIENRVPENATATFKLVREVRDANNTVTQLQDVLVNDQTVTVTLDGTVDTAPTGSDPVGYEFSEWNATFANLRKFDDNGVEITYAVVEIDQDAVYTVNYSNGSGTFRFAENDGVITNRYTSFIVEKRWMEDGFANWNATYGSEDDHVKTIYFKLYRQVGSDPAYVVDEHGVGVTSGNGVMSLSYTDTCPAPNSETYTGGVAVDKGDTIHWMKKFPLLPGTNGEYFAVECNSDGTVEFGDPAQKGKAKTDYENVYMVCTEFGLDVTGETREDHGAFCLKNKLVKVEVDKTWVAIAGTDYTDNYVLKLELLQNNSAIRTVNVPKGDNNWHYEMDDLPMADADGQPYSYAWREIGVYASMADAEENNGDEQNNLIGNFAVTQPEVKANTECHADLSFGIINTGVTQVSVTKLWKLNGIEVDSPDDVESIIVDLKRTAGNEVKLIGYTDKAPYAEIQEEGYVPVTIQRQEKTGGGYEWPTVTIQNLPKYYLDGTEVKTYNYHFVERAVEGWSTTYQKQGSQTEPSPTGSSVTTEGDDTIIITNSKFSVSLPATGGVGTGVVYGAGAALVLLAVLGMILTKRKRTDGEGIR